MIDKHIKSAWNNLICAILYKALEDVERGVDPYKSDAVWFANTEWCQDLCLHTRTDYRSYLKKIKEYI